MEQPQLILINSPIIVAIITAVIGPIVIKKIIAYKKKHRKNLSTIIKSQDLFDQFTLPFKEKFGIPDLEENYFLSQTGIQTNNKTINSFLDLKNKLGIKYTWDIINEAKPFYVYSDNEIVVSISKWQKFYNEFIIILGLLLILSGVSLGVYLNHHFKDLKPPDLLIIFFTISTPIGFGYFLLNHVQPYIYARNIRKKLKL